MLIKRSPILLLCLCAVLPAHPQPSPQQVTVDPWFSLTFPGKVTHYDSLGVTIYQTTVDHTTYQVVRQAHAFQPNPQGESVLMDAGAQSMMSSPKFNALSKKVSDSVISGSRGRFIEMDGDDRNKPYHIFIFITVQETNIYSVQCTSFKPLAICLQDAHYFFSHAIFGPQRVPVKQH